MRERKSDIPLLVNAFLKESSQENNKNVNYIDPEAMERLMNYDWPGNARELRNVLESIVVMSTSDSIKLADLPVNIRGMESSQPSTITQPGMSMEEIEKEAIRKALEDTDGNRTRAAEILKIGLRTLHRKIQKYGLS
jgi:DNA-binding NtrC family response regulator